MVLMVLPGSFETSIKATKITIRRISITTTWKNVKYYMIFTVNTPYFSSPVS